MGEQGDFKSQQAAILAVLIAAGGEWVPTSELAKLSLQYSARIHSLRHDLKLQIESRTERVNGKKFCWFRLLTGAEARQGELLLTGVPNVRYPD